MQTDCKNQTLKSMFDNLSLEHFALIPFFLSVFSTVDSIPFCWHIVKSQRFYVKTSKRKCKPLKCPECQTLCKGNQERNSCTVTPNVVDESEIFPLDFD